MKLPLLLSVPHAGLEVPTELADLHQLSADQIAEDGDVQAAQIYDLANDVAHLVTTSYARAFVDINRAPDDVRKDGVVKSHTCWDVPIWRERPADEVFERVIERCHRPYHARLSELAGRAHVGVDCHTMAAHGPPVGPDPGRERPLACIGIGEGTCPPEWAEALAHHLRTHLGEPVLINDPFRGGYVIRSHASEMPWLMIELSRTERVSVEHKRAAILASLRAWADDLAQLR